MNLFHGAIILLQTVPLRGCDATPDYGATVEHMSLNGTVNGVQEEFDYAGTQQFSVENVQRIVVVYESSTNGLISTKLIFPYEKVDNRSALVVTTKDGEGYSLSYVNFVIHRFEEKLHALFNIAAQAKMDVHG
ncbi:hypothetical protein RB195_008401 [Necator americanus]|uniref:Uncharacterized protein n=1 Tax=Necator americanus TaxID=51031 RepID=A0ABR1CNG4_NECAM